MIDVVLDVEVANRNVAMVDIVSVGVPLIVRAQILRDFFFLPELQSWKRHLANVRGCIPGLSFFTLKGTTVSILWMLEIAIVGETTSFAKTEESPPSTQQFC
jgi:hypothetical protein